ncbi:MAG: type II toxin-antitoxin system RelE/ParE family toxin [Bacteroidetes bacterium]|nr:type II toxin-antitoxin system RelE/ParE family toxin [Bacteroidota bacterium]
MSTHQYTIKVKRSARKEIKAISTKRDRQRVIKRIAALADDPRPPGSVKLSGREAYRIRQGRYRIIYTIEGVQLIIEVVKVGPRGSVYRS